MLDPPFTMPEDARTLAWRNLKVLKERLEYFQDQVLLNHLALDEYSLNHLAESKEKIQRALDSRINVGVDFW